MSCDFEQADLYKAKIVTTRKPHLCVECSKKIEVKQQAEKVDSLFDGTFQTIYTCLDCVKVRDFIKDKYSDREDVLCCHGEVYNFLSEEGLLITEEDIEKEASKWIPNYDSRIGVVLGRHCTIASDIHWLKRNGNKFYLIEDV